MLSLMELSTTHIYVQTYLWKFITWHINVFVTKNFIFIVQNATPMYLCHGSTLS